MEGQQPLPARGEEPVGAEATRLALVGVAPQPGQLLLPIVRGRVNYFRIGHASRCFAYVRDWVETKLPAPSDASEESPGSRPEELE